MFEIMMVSNGRIELNVTVVEAGFGYAVRLAASFMVSSTRVVESNTTVDAIGVSDVV